jgi:hypothetical protein
MLQRWPACSLNKGIGLPPAPLNTLTRCLRNRVQAKCPFVFRGVIHSREQGNGCFGDGSLNNTVRLELRCELIALREHFAQGH